MDARKAQLDCLNSKSINPKHSHEPLLREIPEETSVDFGLHDIAVHYLLPPNLTFAHTKISSKQYHMLVTRG